MFTIQAPSNQRVAVNLLSLNIPIPRSGGGGGEGGGGGGGIGGRLLSGTNRNDTGTDKCQAGMLQIYDGPEVNSDKQLTGFTLQ